MSIRKPDSSKKTLLSLSELSFLSAFFGTFCTDNLSFTNTFGINKDGYYQHKVVLESLRVSGNIFSVPSKKKGKHILPFEGRKFGVVGIFCMCEILHGLLFKQCWVFREGSRFSVCLTEPHSDQKQLITGIQHITQRCMLLFEIDINNCSMATMSRQ